MEPLSTREAFELLVPAIKDYSNLQIVLFEVAFMCIYFAVFIYFMMKLYGPQKVNKHALCPNCHTPQPRLAMGFPPFKFRRMLIDPTFGGTLVCQKCSAKLQARVRPKFFKYQFLFVFLGFIGMAIIATRSTFSPAFFIILIFGSLILSFVSEKFLDRFIYFEVAEDT